MEMPRRRSGAGLPAWSGHAPGPGVVLSTGAGAGAGRNAYVGIADPRATHVVVHAPKPFAGWLGLIGALDRMLGSPDQDMSLPRERRIGEDQVP